MSNLRDRVDRYCLSFLVIGLVIWTGCHVGRSQTVDALDPIPSWYNDEYRDSVYSFFTYGWQYASELGFPGSSIIDMRLLAWQAFSEDRPLVDSNHILYQSMLWVHMRSPIMKRDGWALVRIFGRPGGWRLTHNSVIQSGILIYDHPPRNAEIYAANLWVFYFELDRYRPIYDGYLRINTWKAVTGDEPTRQFLVRHE
jgi:hypothetical protein